MPHSPHDTDTAAPDVDRRHHPRRPAHTPLEVRSLKTWARVTCEAVDVSIGGIRVRAARAVPLGGCELVAAPGTEHALVLLGCVLESVVDATDGTCTARIELHPVLTRD